MILLLAILSASASALIVRRSMTPTPVPLPVDREPMIEVLVMARAAEPGETIATADLRWHAWPASALPTGAVSRSPGTTAPPFEPAMARFPLIAGEPVADAKLIRPGKGGTLAALTGAGRRAVAVPLREESAAGGLLQPNDRVDVIWTPGQTDNPADRLIAKTLLRGVRILAIGKSLQASARGEARTATLELSPGQARIVAGARTRGEITLALVPAADESGGAPEDGDAPEAAAGIRVIRYGR